MPAPLPAACATVSRDSRVGLADHAIELLLETGDLALERVLALAEHLRLLHAIGPACGRSLRSSAMSCCSCGDLLGLALRVLDVALGARALLALQLPLRLAQPLGGGGRLACRARIAVRGGAAHRVGGLRICRAVSARSGRF